jgi:DNA-directed RNA polymerase specialized sigma24 family protein
MSLSPDILPGQGDYNDPMKYEMGEEKQFKGYVTNILTDLSIDWIKNREKEKPFMLMYHHKAPHRRWIPDEKHAHMYEDVDIPEPYSFHDDYEGKAQATKEATMRIDRDLMKRDVKADPPIYYH